MLLMDGHTWTHRPELAERIDASQDNDGGMVCFNVTDGEEFEYYKTHLAGICTEQRQITPEVIEYRVRIEDHVDAADSKPWAIQLCLIPTLTPIGEVGFALPGKKYPVMHTGRARVRLLKIARDGGALPNGLRLVAQSSGAGPWRDISPSEVSWDGLEITRI